MGKFVIAIGAGDPKGDQFHDVEVTVDTGSTFTALPGSMLRELGVPVERTARARLADGSSKSVEIGHTMVRLEGRTFPTPVIFAGPAEPSLLGVVTLETALLAVDPVGQRLIPVDADQLRASQTTRGHAETSAPSGAAPPAGTAGSRTGR